MGIENLVIKEVDSWGSSTINCYKQQVEYDAIKPIYRGIGIHVVKHIIKELTHRRVGISFGKSYPSNYKEAVKEFKKDFLCWVLAQNDFNVTKTAVNIGLAHKKKSAQSELNRWLKEYGLTSSKIKKDPEKYIVAGLIKPKIYVKQEKLVEIAINEIKKYIQCIDSNFREDRDEYLKELAEKLADVTKRFFISSFQNNSGKFLRLDNIMNSFEIGYTHHIIRYPQQPEHNSSIPSSPHR